jgi:putative Mn2+ efflux pump MntP
MQAILLAALFGLAANLDNVGIGIAYGAMRRPIRLFSNLLIALLTTCITILALAGGIEMRTLMPERLPDLLGGSLLIALAGVTFWADSANGANHGLPRTVLRFSSRHKVGLAETLMLTLTLSLNNIGLAIAGGIGGIGYRAAAIAVFAFSVGLLAVGQRIGRNALRLPRRLSQLINGHAVLAMVGVLMLTGH